MSHAMMTLSYRAEMEFACLYAMRKPALARKCAVMALDMACRMQNPALAYNARALLAAI